MNVLLTTFQKRVNSTKVPSSFSVTYPCILKDSCSILKPVISLDLSLLTSPSSYNYAEIPSFNRYYYIKNWTFNNRLWNAELEVDVLASHKSDITTSYAYIVRCSKFYDGNIIDTFYPAKTTFTEYVSYWINGNRNSPWEPLLSNGTYVVGIINEDSQSIGGVSYYALTPNQFSTLKYALLHNSDWTNIETTNPDIGLNLYKSLFNPFQYIVSIKWFPFSISTDHGTIVSYINVGWWQLPGVSGLRLSVFAKSFQHLFSFEEHPLASTRGNYLNTAPYTKYVMYSPPFGEIELDASKFSKAIYTNGKAYVDCVIDVDLISGDGSMNIDVVGTTPYFVNKISSKISVDIQLAQLYSEHNVGDIVSTGGISLAEGAKTISNIASNLLNLDFDSAIEEGKNLGDMTRMVTDALSVGTVHLSQIGSNGSLAQYAFEFKLITTHMDIVDDDNNDFGRPYCKHDILNNFSPGYVQTLNAHVASDGCKEEVALINMYLDGGVYIE